MFEKPLWLLILPLVENTSQSLNMKETPDVDWEIDIQLQIFECTCQIGILPHLQSFQTTKL